MSKYNKIEQAIKEDSDRAFSLKLRVFNSKGILSSINLRIISMLYT